MTELAQLSSEVGSRWPAAARPIPTVVRLVGAVGVERGARQATERDLPGRQARLAFVMLAWEHDRQIAHDELADALWPTGPPSTWQPALRAIVSKVRGVFDHVGLPGARIVSGGAGRYELRLPEGAAVDVEQALATLQEGEQLLARRSVVTARGLANEARTLLSRPLLPGVDSPWLDRRRDELTAALVRCLELLGECRRRASEFDHAAIAVEELLTLDPFRESAWRLLMKIHVGAGNDGEALLAFERCRYLLAEELGADPAPETQRLHRRILEGAKVTETREAESDGPILVARVDRTPIDGPPYRGLEAFDEQHAAMFFGREEAIGALVDRLRAHRFVAVVGASGTGKSSLVRAGLLPALAAGALPEADTWRRLVMVPGHDPLEALRSALASMGPDPDTSAAVDRLGEHPAALHEAASAILAGRRTSEQLLVIVDQFEELFTLCTDEEVRAAFVATLLEATRRIDSRTVVVLTMRADFYPRAAMISELAAALSTSQFVICPMAGDELEQAIEQPARLAGLKFEDGLVGRILGEIAGEPGALPLLQHALLELWERRVDHLLTRGAYEDTGGVPGAVARRAELTWEALAQEERDVARRVLLRLTQPGDGTEDTRRRVPLGELSGVPSSEHLVVGVVRRLADARLLTTSANSQDVQPWVEVAHEALIRGWPRLAGWIDENRAGLRVHRRLTDAAGQWDEHDRHEDYLLSGTRLAEASDWAQGNDPDLNEMERAFLDASLATTAERVRRRTRARRLTVSGLAATVVVVGILALVAMVQRGRADEQELLAESRQVAAEAVTQLDIDPELSLLLALEAHGIAPTAESEAALRQAVVRSHVRFRLPAEGSEPSVSVSPHGGVAAVYSVDGLLRLWDIDTGEHLADLTDAAGEVPDGPVDGVAFSPDGNLVAASNLDGEGWIWSVPDGELVRELVWQSADTLVYVVAEQGLSWSPDGRQLLVAGFDGRARLFEAATGDLVRTLQASPDDLLTNVLARASFSPDGQWIAVEGAAGTVALFDAVDRNLVLEFVGHEARLWALNFSPDGSRLATASDDATVRVWDATDGQALHTLVHAGPVRDVAFSPDGTRILTGDHTGQARIWDAESGELVRELAGHESRVNMVRFDSRGRLALTASLDGTARIWDSTTGEPVGLLTGSSDPVIDAEFTPDGQRVVTAGDDARVWEVPTGATSALDAHDGPVVDLALTADGGVLVTGGSGEGIARAWPVGGDEPIAVWSDHDVRSLPYVDITRDGGLVVTSPTYLNPGLANEPGPARVWDGTTGRLVTELSMPDSDPYHVCGGRCAVSDVVFAPDGGSVALASFDGLVRLFDPRTGALQRTLKGSTGFVAYVDWSPDGGHIAAAHGAAGNVSVRVWSAATGDQIAELTGWQTLSLNRIRLGPDGQIIAVNLGATTRVIEVETGDLVAELRHRGAARDAAFSPDGSLIVTASDAGASIWDVASQRRLVDLLGHPGEVLAVRFTGDGTIVTGGVDGAVRFFACEVCQPIDRLLDLARERVTRELTPAERAKFLPEGADSP